MESEDLLCSWNRKMFSLFAARNWFFCTCGFCISAVLLDASSLLFDNPLKPFHRKGAQTEEFLPRFERGPQGSIPMKKR